MESFNSNKEVPRVSAKLAMDPTHPRRITISQGRWAATEGDPVDGAP